MGTTVRRMSRARREMADGRRILDGLRRRRILRGIRTRGGSRERRRRWRRSRSRGRIRRRQRSYRTGSRTRRTRLVRGQRTSRRLATEARNAKYERKSSHGKPSGHTLVPVVIGRFDLPRLPALKKAGGVTSINLPPRPCDVIDVIVSVEGHQAGVMRKLAHDWRPSRLNEERKRTCVTA